MNSEQVLNKMKAVKNNIDNARIQLRKAREILEQSITFNDVGFKYDEISNLRANLYSQVNILDNKIIPKIENM